MLFVMDTVFFLSFLQRVRIAMQSAVLARTILFDCLSVWCFVQTNENTIVRFSASGKISLLLSGEVEFIRIFVGDHSHSEDVKVRHPSIDSENLTNNRP